MADLHENDMVQRIPAYLRCLDAAGNSGLVIPDSILTKSLTFKGWINGNSINIDEINETGFYALSGTSAAKYGFGVLIDFNCGVNFDFQFNMDAATNAVSLRNRWGSSWSNWKDL